MRVSLSHEGLSVSWGSLCLAQALVVWNRFVDFEYSRGDLQAMHKASQRSKGGQ